MVPGSPDRHARRLHGPGFLPLLCLLGSHAGPHVLADRHLGWATQALRCYQVFLVHIGRFGSDAIGNLVPVFQSPRTRQSLYIQH